MHQITIIYDKKYLKTLHVQKFIPVGDYKPVSISVKVEVMN